MTHQHPIGSPILDFTGIIFDDYDEEDGAGEPEPPPFPLFQKLNNDEIMQKVEE